MSQITLCCPYCGHEIREEDESDYDDICENCQENYAESLEYYLMHYPHHPFCLKKGYHKYQIKEGIMVCFDCGITREITEEERIERRNQINWDKRISDYLRKEKQRKQEKLEKLERKRNLKKRESFRNV